MIFERKFGRRSFLKGSAAAAAVAGVAVAGPGNTIAKALAAGEKAAATADRDQIFYGTCRSNCFSGCRLKIHVRNQKVTMISMGELPDSRYNKICAKGFSHVQRIYDPKRVKYPLKRVGERGSNQWEQITWDEAIEIIGNKWEGYQKEFGKESIAYYCNSGNFGQVGWRTPARLFNLMGSCSIAPNIDEAYVKSSINALGYGQMMNSNEYTDRLNSKTIIIWGANPTEAQPQNWHFMAEARKDNGTTIIVIDPNYTASAAKADIHVPIRPGTDAALALGMMNYIIQQGWTDKGFLQKSSVAPLLVKDDGKYLRQSDVTGKPPADPKVDPFIVWDSQANTHGLVTEVLDPAISGIYTIADIKVTTAYTLLLNRVAEYPPEKAAEICDVPVETIREIARIYATNTPSSIYQQYGVDHYVNAHYGIFSIFGLGMITGNIGKEGACCGITGGASNYLNTGALLNPPGAVPGPVLAHAQIPNIMKEKQYAGKSLTIKSLYVYNANPIGVFAERKSILEAINKIDFLVVADLFMSETAMYADILLPAAHWFETDDMAISTNTGYLMLQEKAIEPLYGSKPDYQIAALLAKRMGYGDYFNYEPKDYMLMALDSDAARELSITCESLLEKKVVRGLPAKTWIHGENGVFPTPTGRVQFYIENPKPTFDYGQKFDVAKERLPYLFEPPNEAWHENPLFEKYPLVCYQEKVKWRVHTQWTHTPWLRELDPEPIVKLNSIDAEARGVKDGDVVRVFNDRGYVIIKAVINNGLRPGMVNIPHGWQKDQYIEGHYQDLTSNVVNPLYVNNAYFDTLVQIEKA
ncbi:hypothetical protein AT727_19775 [Desulfitobacterium hafniense]|uniref:4Fe-4S Mo/W bis-MGD-type domain-containing protein n=2 Tax=Desulfitobacterium hafniense TaxID=49338 RepID=A0A0W1JMQ9_DESHA|nr:hypothetical protein AT727_19775 [Desulfitobacterium hafniense]